MSKKNSEIIIASARAEIKRCLRRFLKKNARTFFAVENLVERIKFPKLVKKTFPLVQEREWEVADSLEQLIEEKFLAKREFQGITYYGMI